MSLMDFKPLLRGIGERLKTARENAGLSIDQVAETINLSFMDFRPLLRGIGERLKTARENAGLSIDQVAETVNASRRLLESYEAGQEQISVVRLVELAKAYKVSPEWLIGGGTEYAWGPRNGVIRLRELRLVKNITQLELAALSGVSLATIVRLEQGRHPPRISTVRKLANVLEVEPAELIKVNGG